MGHQPSLERYSKTCYFSRQVSFVSKNPLPLGMGSMSTKINDVREILNYCWFEALYVDMINDDDEIAYAVEGEGDWGTEVGFVIRDNKVIYEGVDYLDYIKNV